MPLALEIALGIVSTLWSCEARSKDDGGSAGKGGGRRHNVTVRLKEEARDGSWRHVGAEGNSVQ